MSLQVAIADVASELADPRQHREPRWEWSQSRHRVPAAPHVTTQAPLIVQLYDAVAPLLSCVDESGSAHSAAASSPPLQLDALARYLDIGRQAARWCRLLDVDERGNPCDDIRALAGANHRDHAPALLADLRRWRSWAATMSGWQAIYTPRAACPVIDCQASGTLRINLHSESAICTACGSWWDQATISILAAHIADSTDGHEPIRVRTGRAGHGGWASRATQLTNGAAAS